MRGLYNKYVIQKADGATLDPDAKYLVLRYDAKGGDKAAMGAVLEYASLIADPNRDLGVYSLELDEQHPKSYTNHELAAELVTTILQEIQACGTS